MVASSVGLVAAGVAVSAGLHLPWGSSLSHWPHVPPPELFVVTQPKQEDVVGVYELTRQTITGDGLAVLGGRPCQLDLRPDGSFTVTNYPQWGPVSSGAAHVTTSETPGVTTFTSTKGRWCCDKVNIMYDGKMCWGVVFSDSDTAIDALALRRKGEPYDLMLTYGDGDDGTIMQFGRKK